VAGLRGLIVMEFGFELWRMNNVLLLF
jgi:hypothetical protein